MGATKTRTRTKNPLYECAFVEFIKAVTPSGGRRSCQRIEKRNQRKQQQKADAGAGPGAAVDCPVPVRSRLFGIVHRLAGLVVSPVHHGRPGQPLSPAL